MVTPCVIGDQRLDRKMPAINMPHIIAEELDGYVLAAIVAGQPRYVLKTVGLNFTPLPKTWYEEEVDTETTRTIRFAKRSDHTGILFKIEKTDFYDHAGKV